MAIEIIVEPFIRDWEQNICFQNFVIEKDKKHFFDITLKAHYKWPEVIKPKKSMQDPVILAFEVFGRSEKIKSQIMRTTGSTNIPGTIASVLFQCTKGLRGMNDVILKRVCLETSEKFLGNIRDHGFKMRDKETEREKMVRFIPGTCPHCQREGSLRKNPALEQRTNNAYCSECFRTCHVDCMDDKLENSLLDWNAKDGEDGNNNGTNRPIN